MKPAAILPRSTRASTAFTLVEMLVTTAVLSIFLIVMIGILDQASRAWNQAEQRVDAFREGRAAQFILDRDLTNLATPSGQPSFFHNAHSDTIQIGATLPPETNGDSLFFTALLPLNAQSGNQRSHLCIVGYYLAYTPDSSGPQAQRSYKLYRHLTDSEDAFPILSSFFKTGTTPLVSVIPRPVSGLIGDEVLARNIINFKITPLRRNDNTGDLEPVPGTWSATERPAMVKVSFDAFNYNTAASLRKPADWYESPELVSLRQSQGQTFTSLVNTESTLLP